MSAPFGTVAVVGTGTVGAALVSRFARAGVPVIAVEADEASAAAARDRVADLAAPDTAAVTYTADLGRISDADVVIEALPERLSAKTELLHAAGLICRPDTIFVTTTTAFPVMRLGVAGGRPDRTVGLHLINAATAVSAELVATPVTDPAVIEDMAGLAARAGLAVVRVHDRPGFLSGALLMRYLNGAVALLEQRYATRDDIDAAMRLGCGLPTGPLAQLDLIGLDVALDTLRALHERTGRRAFAPAPLLATMVEAGLLGRKSGRGFYTHPAGPDETAAAPAVHAGAAPARVAVVGSGTIARGFAEASVRSGIAILLVSRSTDGAKRAGEAVDRALESAVQRGRLSAEAAAAAQARLEVSTDLDRVCDADLVLESVSEDLAVKRSVFAELDRLARPGAVLATGTSGLPVVACARATGRPQDVVGLHFFHPVPVMRLAEVVRTPLTADHAVDRAAALCAALGKRAVHCADRAGFVVNALLLPYLNDAIRMLGETYAADDIDAVMRDGCGFPMGPLALLDMIGLDVCLAVQNRLYEAFHDPELRPADLLVDLVGSGQLGRKTGRGLREHRVAAEGRTDR